MRLLIADTDANFRNRLVAAFTSRGYEVTATESTIAYRKLDATDFDFAVIDLWVGMRAASF